MRFIDLSVPLDNDRSWAPWWARNRVKRQDHKFGQRVIRWLFGIRKQHLATGLGWANIRIESIEPADPDRFSSLQRHVHEIVRLQRTGDPERIPTGVPERLRPYLGSYLLAQLRRGEAPA